MSEAERMYVQYLVNIGGAGFVIVMGFTQLADYFTDRKARHLIATAAWLVLSVVFILRTAGVPDPPLIDAQIIADWTAIGWACAELLGLCWGVLRLFEKRAQSRAQRKLGLDGSDPVKEIEA